MYKFYTSVNSYPNKKLKEHLSALNYCYIIFYLLTLLSSIAQKHRSGYQQSFALGGLQSGGAL